MRCRRRLCLRQMSHVQNRDERDLNSTHDELQRESRGRHLQTMRKWGFPSQVTPGQIALVHGETDRKTAPTPAQGKGRDHHGEEPASGHTLLVLHFQAQSPGLTIRHGKIRMPKPFNLQLVHLYPNSNLLGFELKQHMHTHTHT